MNRRKDGRTFTEEASISPVRDASGDIKSFVAVKRDISGELDLQARFLQAQKMESVGRLAGGVAHDFNNLLTVILSAGEDLRQAIRAGRTTTLRRSTRSSSREGEPATSPVRCSRLPASR